MSDFQIVRFFKIVLFSVDCAKSHHRVMSDALIIDRLKVVVQEREFSQYLINQLDALKTHDSEIIRGPPL